MARDGQGLEVSNAGVEAIDALDFLADEWLGFGNRLAVFIAAADKDERCAMLPVLAANLMLSMNSADGHAMAKRYLARAKELARDPNPRERAWIEATEAWVAGETDRSLAIHEDMVDQWPRDLLAGKLGQLHAFNRGDAEALLRIGERLFAANRDNHFVYAMYAFGLEECNRIDEAEATARQALAMERSDPWAHHAHRPLPGGTRQDDRGRGVPGIGQSDTWEGCNSFMYTHNWWHLALFLIDLDRTDEALALFDRRVWGVWKEFSEDQINAVSLLARLEMRGVDVGARWADVASYLRPRLHEHFVPFLDLQYLYGAGARRRAERRHRNAGEPRGPRRATPSPSSAKRGPTAPCRPRMGWPPMPSGDLAEAARLLGQAMPHLQPIGGSIAQRALFGAHPSRCADQVGLERRRGRDPAGRRSRAARPCRRPSARWPISIASSAAPSRR